MKSKLLALINKPFLRNIIVLSLGTAAAQIIGILASPIITRLYGPETYGLMGTFTTIISIIAPVAALTYPIAIVLPKDDREALGLIKLSLLITTVISILILLLLIFFNKQIIVLFNIEDIAPFLIFIPFIIFLAGLLQVMEQWLIRTKQFVISAKATLFQSILVNIGKVGIGFFHPIASVLILFTSLSQGIKATFIFLFIKNTNFLVSLKNATDKISFIKLSRKYKDFPLYRSPQTFIDAITQGLPVLMLASFFGPASVGFYNIGKTVLSIPSSLIGKSVGDVFYPELSKAANNNSSITKILLKGTFLLIGIGILPFGVIIIFGPQIFSFVFGPDWLVAGEYARWISLWSFSSFILQPSLRALPVLHAQRFHLLYTIVSLIIRLLLLGLGNFVFSSDIVSVALFGVSSGILNMILISITLLRSNKIDLSKG